MALALCLLEETTLCPWSATPPPKAPLLPPVQAWSPATPQLGDVCPVLQRPRLLSSTTLLGRCGCFRLSHSRGNEGTEGDGGGRRGTEARTAAGEREGGDSPPDPLTRVCAELGSDLIPRPQDDPAAQGRVSLQGTLWREAEPDCVPGHRCLLPAPQTPCCPQRKGREGESGHRPLPTDALASCALSWRPLTAMTKQRPAGAQGRLAGQCVGGPAGGLEVWKQHVRGTQSRAPG